MTARMEFRGPDATGSWHAGRAGLGHTLLQTTMKREAAQPLTLDGRTHATADARLDGPAELAAALRSAGAPVSPDAGHAELILRAYAAWGEACVEHLLGDFSFAIWDARNQSLFCARDRFGVKPFFYARAGGSFAFSNTLDALLGHPGVALELDDVAVADFLLFDAMQDTSRTAYAAIRRLPPAHCLTVRDGVVATRRYWALAADHGVQYRDRRDYVEEFLHLLDRAVADRLGAQRVGVSMSGGLDSPAIAAAAQRVARRSGRALELRAHTLVYDSLIPDRERHFSQTVARALHIPIQHRAADGYPLYAGNDSPLRRLGEPSHEPEGAAAFELLCDQATSGRVCLMGWDGDALLRESPKPYFRSLWRERRLGRLAAGIAWYSWNQKRLVPRSLRRTARGARGAGSDDGYPAWLNPDLERDLALRDRWRAAQDAPAVDHPLRPYAHRVFSWLDRSASFFERFDPGFTRLHLELRHPFLDLRLVDFCLRLPPVPWCVDKRILRDSLVGLVPEEIRRRPKTTLGQPGYALLARDDSRWVDDFVATDGLERYIVRKRIPPVWGTADPEAAWSCLRPLTLNFWLQNRATSHRQETHA